MTKIRSKNAPPTPEDIYTITRLNHEVRQLLEEVFPTIWVEGEISNLAKPASGHFYFTLKDDNAQVRCAFFKNRQANLNFGLDNGIKVLAKVNVNDDSIMQVIIIIFVMISKYPKGANFEASAYLSDNISRRCPIIAKTPINDIKNH